MLHQSRETRARHSFLDATQNGLPLSQNSNVLLLRPAVRNANKNLDQHQSPPPSNSLGRTPRESPTGIFIHSQESTLSQCTSPKRALQPPAYGVLSETAHTAPQ